MMEDVQELELLDELEKTSSGAIPPLRDGDRLTRDEFERRYEAMPHVKKAELIEGVVHMPSPVSQDDHSAPHFDFITWLGIFRTLTPGIQGGDNGTLRLDLHNEPQPDAFLMILPSHGGRVRISSDGYVESAPDWLGEVSASSAGNDLGSKLRVYQSFDVREYVVWRTLDRAIDWFVLRGGQFQRLLPGPDGIYRSEVLPGLWLDPKALLNGDMPRVMQVVQQGVASPEHAAFVQELRQAAGTNPP